MGCILLENTIIANDTLNAYILFIKFKYRLLLNFQENLQYARYADFE